jgi:hypothetical protein
MITDYIITVAIYIQLNGRFSVLMPPYSAVSHAMQIHSKSTIPTVDMFKGL